MGEWMREQRTKQRTKLPARSARANTYRQRFLCSVFAQQCRQKNNSNTVEDMLTEFKGLEQLLQVPGVVRMFTLSGVFSLVFCVFD